MHAFTFIPFQETLVIRLLWAAALFFFYMSACSTGYTIDVSCCECGVGMVTNA